MSSPRSLSPWWALLLLPVGLLAGHLIGGAPVAPRANETVSPTALTRIGRDDTANRMRRDGAAEVATEAAQPAPQPDAGATGPVQWVPIAQAVEQSRQTGKPILFDFNADWCGPCQQMKGEVFESTMHARQIEAAALPVSVVDRQRELGVNPPDLESLQRRFEVRAFPTLVLLNAKTGQMVKSEGYMGETETVEWITRTAESLR